MTLTPSNRASPSSKARSVSPTPGKIAPPSDRSPLGAKPTGGQNHSGEVAEKRRRLLGVTRQQREDGQVRKGKLGIFVPARPADVINTKIRKSESTKKSAVCERVRPSVACLDFVFSSFRDPRSPCRIVVQRTKEQENSKMANFLRESWASWQDSPYPTRRPHHHRLLSRRSQAGRMADRQGPACALTRQDVPSHANPPRRACKL